MTTQNNISTVSVAQRTTATQYNQIANNLALPGWSGLPLAAGWVANGGGGEAPGYWQDGYGLIYLRGAIKNTTGGTVAVAGTVATLPAGSRPLNTRSFAAMATTNNNTPGQIFLNIYNTGVIQIVAFLTRSGVGALDTGIPNNGYIILDGIILDRF